MTKTENNNSNHTKNMDESEKSLKTKKPCVSKNLWIKKQKFVNWSGRKFITINKINISWLKMYEKYA